MTQRVGSNRIANNAITLDKIASGVLDSASDLYARAHVNAAFEAANTIDVTAQVQPAYNHANAAFDAANNVQSDAIVNGTSNVRVESSGGNVQITIGGTTQTTISTNLVSHNEGVL